MSPLGFDWKISVAVITGAAAKEMVLSTLGILYGVGQDDIESSLPNQLRNAKGTDGQPIYNMATTVALLLFVLLYFPCIAAVVTVRNEAGSWRWALFVVAYTTLLAWIVAFVAYNIIAHGIIQEVVVAIIILLCLLFAANRVVSSRKSKSKCSSCGMC